MPYVNVRITKDGVTTAQKRQIVEEITQTLVRVLGKRPEHTHIIIDEVEPENWGFAGMLTTEYRRRDEQEQRFASEELNDEVPAAKNPAN
ncbi:MAG: 4-oxalocrotonate tautomerase family protein [Pyrinomonadaceae bacterium]|nr:4-oxalocrotonate tautomerase family protein [Pyrinomonadaceae bacterium]